ncbi:MAG: DUF4276 family protein [Isosphaeraceae bacterium]
MVEEVRFYIEGDPGLRQGFGHFFGRVRRLARDRRVRWDLKLCGHRTNAFGDFERALTIHPNAFCLLLVDSEGPLDPNASLWDRLRSHDDWSPPPKTLSDKCHLMVQSMEAWFLADAAAMKRCFGPRFDPKPLPNQPNVESLEKSDLYDRLSKAIRNTPKMKYDKVSHGAALLSALDEAVVRKRAPHCDRLFRVLEQKITGAPPAP